MLREKGSLHDGVQLDNGGTLRVLFPPDHDTVLPQLSKNVADNVILGTVLALKNQGFDVRFISKDINARVKADSLGLQAFDYLKDVVSQDDVYKGWVKVQVPSLQLKTEYPEDLEQLHKEYNFTTNEYVILESKNNPYNYALFRYLANGQFKRVNLSHLKWPFQPKNVQQLMTFDLLLDDSIQFVSLLGGAGTGKTFLTLVCALHKVIVEQAYEKILISRPVIPLGPDIGFLPGDVQEKLHSWMQPIYDNMDLIIHSANVSEHYQQEEKEFKEFHNHKKSKFKNGFRDRNRNLATLQELIKQGKISLEAITYMRGRSIPYQYIFIDEVQNLTPHEVKTIVSRVGEGSKIVIAGDPYQIDSPYLDFSSNGLVVTSTKFKGQDLFGTVFLETSERSALSKLAAEIL